MSPPGCLQVAADNKVYNVFLDGNGAEQRRYVGDIRDVRTFKASLALIGSVLVAKNPNGASVAMGVP